MAKNRDKKKRAITQAQNQRRQDKALLPQPAFASATAPATAEPAADKVCMDEPANLCAEALLLTASDLCAMLQISRASFYRMQKAGIIPGRIVLGGQVRYHRQTLER